MGRLTIPTLIAVLAATTAAPAQTDAQPSATGGTVASASSDKGFWSFFEQLGLEVGPPRVGDGSDHDRGSDGDDDGGDSGGSDGHDG